MGDASQNKPMKELLFALVGVVAFAVLVGFIAVSGWLRPAGAHYGPETAENAEVVETVTEAEDEKAEATSEETKTTDNDSSKDENTNEDSSNPAE